MIYYMVSYPRSGNSWIRRVLKHKFGLTPSSVYGDSNKNAPSRKWRVDPHTWDGVFIPFLASFEEQNSNGPADKYFLLPGCKDELTPDRRRVLASAESAFFLKTHEPPFKEHFDGEHFILIKRHPGASLWSYFHFLRDRSHPSITLDEVIRGCTPHGDWSEFHRAWRIAKQENPKCFSEIQYEDLHSQFELVVLQLESFLGKQALEAEMPSFDKLRVKNPSMFRSGTPDEWVQNYSSFQMELLWKCHGDEALVQGYTPKIRALR